MKQQKISGKIVEQVGQRARRHFASGEPDLLQLLYTYFFKSPCFCVKVFLVYHLLIER